MDTFGQKKRSWIMAQVKPSGNESTEMNLRAVLRKNGITGWRRNYKLFGKPDFVFLEKRVAVFVDGCFWHGHPQKCRIPKTNRQYWEMKILRNMKRDRLVTSTLRKKGWKVVRVWENSIRKPMTITRLKKVLE